MATRTKEGIFKTETQNGKVFGFIPECVVQEMCNGEYVAQLSFVASSFTMRHVPVVNVFQVTSDLLCDYKC